MTALVRLAHWRWRLARWAGRWRGRSRHTLEWSDFTQRRNFTPLPHGLTRYQALSSDPLARTPLRLPAGWYQLHVCIEVEHRREDPWHGYCQVFIDAGAGEQDDQAVGLAFRSGQPAQRVIHLPRPAWLRIDPIDHAGPFAIKTLRVQRMATPPAEVAPEPPRHPVMHYGRWIAEEEARQKAECAALNPAGASISVIPAHELPQLRHAAEQASGNWVMILSSEHDQLAAVAPQALAQVASEWPMAIVIYSDHDIRDTHGFRCEPQFKPGWSPETFSARDYIGPAVWAAREWLLEQLSTAPPSAPLSTPADYRQWLFTQAVAAAEQIAHIPMVLYHQADPKALTGALTGTGTFNAPFNAPLPTLSLLIPTRDGGAQLERCVASVQAQAAAEGLAVEIIVINNQSEDPATLAFLNTRAGFTVLDYDAPFNFSVMNNQAAAMASAQVLGLMNDDVEVTQPQALSQLAAAAMAPEIGCVGPVLLYPNQTVQHAGVVCGVGGIAAHPHRQYPADDSGYAEGLSTPMRNVSAVTGAALFIRKSLYEQLGGMDEALTVAYNDVDLCLKALAAGKRNLLLPPVRLLHHESLSRGDDRTGKKAARLQQEAEHLQGRWGDELRHDFYYNPNLTHQHEDFTLATPLPAILQENRPWGRVQRTLPSGTP